MNKMLAIPLDHTKPGHPVQYMPQFIYGTQGSAIH